MKKVLKIILYILLSIILLVVGVVVAINTPWGKEQIRKYAVDYLQKKLDTKVSIGKIDFSIPTAVNLSKVLVLDKRQDTIVWVNQLDININMLKLIEGRISVSKLGLEGGNINMYRTANDTNFNYQFIVDSFVGKPEASRKEVIDTAKASPIYIDAGLISIRNTRYRFHDSIGGALFGVGINNLVLKPRQIDINTMRFEVADFRGDTISSYFYSRPSALPPTPEDTSAPIEVSIVVDKLQLNKANFIFRDAESAMDFKIQAKSLSAAMPYFSLLNQKIKIDYLNLEETHSGLTFHELSKAMKVKVQEPKDTVSNTDTGSWVIWLNNLLFKDVNFAYDDNNSPRKRSGMDYAHLDIRNFYLTGSDLMYSADTILGTIKNLSMNERSGLNIQTLRTKFIYHERGALLDELFLKTPQTLIQDKIAVSYRSLSSLSEELSQMRLDLALRKSVLSFRDLFIFLPEAQKQQLHDYRNQSLNFTLLANGTVGNLNILQLYLQGLKKTQVDLSGKIFGLPDANKLSYALNIKQLNSTEQDIHSFIPASVRQQLDIPSWFALSGTINGTTSSYHPNMLLRTSDGTALVKGTFSMSKPGRETYDLYLDAQTFNIGKILRMQPELGTITLNGKVKGVGYDPKTMSADIDATVVQAFYHGYNYSNITAFGYIRNKEGQLDLKSRDPNAFLNMQSVFNFRNEYPAVTATMAVDLLDLQALKFVENDLKFTGDIYADVASTNPDYPNGLLSIRNPFVTSNGKTYMFDSVYVYSNPADSLQDIDINIANIINARMTGKIPLTQMGNALLAHVNQYYYLSDTIGSAPLAYDMNLSGTLAYHRLFRQVIPELRPFDTIRFYSLIDPRSLNIGISAPRVRYADMTLDTFAFSAIEQDRSLMYVAGLNRFSQGSIQFYNSSLSGYLRNDSISSFLNLTDREGVDQFALGLTTSINPQSDIVLHLERGLKLNYDDWSVDPLNRIVWGGDKGLFVNQLSLNQGNQLIRINSRDTVFNSPLHIDIQNFSLLNLTKMISKDTVLADGRLFVNGDLDLRDSFPRIVSTVRVDSLFVMGSDLGDLRADVRNENAYSYFADARLTGYGNNLSLVGNYYLKPVNHNELDFKANFTTFSLKSIEGLTFGNLRNSSGIITGDLDIKGTVEKPLVNGVLKTDSLKTTLSMFNTYMSMPEETIRFNSGKGLYFDRFRIYDRYNKLATLSGSMNTDNFIDYTLDMNLKATNWQAMNSTVKDNESIYGKLFMSANLSLEGNMTAPAIDGNITIHDSTDFNYAMLDNPSLVENEGIVMFYDGRDSGWVDSAELNLKKAEYLLAQSSSLNVNIDIEKKAQFTILIDPETGDRLNVKGTSFLNANLGADGSMTLTGTYELEDGYYELNYNLLKKKFKIQKGSMLILAGDPLDADVNITAVYDANAAPYDLVQKQGQESSELNLYRQRMPFQVLLKMSGKMMKPTISFDIVVKEGGLNTVNESVKSFVEGKLSEMRNNPSDMNKQVVSLLLLNRFIAEDPFSSGAGLGFENAVRQSASRFLSEQMNRMAGDLIKGIELDFGVSTSEDFSTGAKVNRTDFNITASKRLFNDRLKLTIGNDFALEGQTAGTTNPSYLPGNLSADYLLTTDGKYILRGYRKSELQNIINGYQIETGLSFRFSLEYNRFRALLMGQERYRAYMRRKREEEARKAAHQKPALSITNTSIE